MRARVRRQTFLQREGCVVWRSPLVDTAGVDMMGESERERGRETHGPTLHRSS